MSLSPRSSANGEGSKRRSNGLYRSAVPVEERVDGIDEDLLQPIGRVVGIVQREANQNFVGVLSKPMAGKPNTTFVPRDSRVPRMLVPLAQCPPEFCANPEVGQAMERE